MGKLEEVTGQSNREDGSLFQSDREAAQVKKDQNVHCSCIGFDLTTRCPAKRCQHSRLRGELGWRGESATESTFLIGRVAMDV